ncbi:MAG: hypothetical protein QXX35_00945 [Desulfurococcaceae archaeon]
MNNMKKLSPSEPFVKIDFTLESLGNYPITKLDKIIRLKHGFKTRIVSSNMVKTSLIISLKNYIDSINKIIDLIDDLKRDCLDLLICIDYKVIVTNTDCYRIGDLINYSASRDRVYSIQRLNDKYIYVYCNKNKKYMSIKYFRQKIYSKIDPYQLTPSLFKYCTSIVEIRDYLINEVKYNLEKVNEYLKMMNALSIDKHRDDY